MRVLTIYNPIAGSGGAAKLAHELVAALDGVRLSSGATLEMRAEPTQAARASTWLDALLGDDIDLLVVVGGDGACRLAAPSAIRAGISLYHYPSGTENLFARDHGMRPDPQGLLRALEEGTHRLVDVFRVEDEWGLLFASVGFDAEVVHDLAKHRSGSISHLSYLGPLLRQLVFWPRRRTRVRVTVDGQCLAPAVHGIGLVANSPQYALRLNPSPRSVLDDGLLDVVLLPARTILGLMIWWLRCRRRSHLSSPRVLHAHGRSVVLELDRPAALQIDGDPPDSLKLHSRYEIEIQPRALSVLVPPSENRPG